MSSKSASGLDVRGSRRAVCAAGSGDGAGAVVGAWPDVPTAASEAGAGAGAVVAGWASAAGAWAASATGAGAVVVVVSVLAFALVEDDEDAELDADADSALSPRSLTRPIFAFVSVTSPSVDSTDSPVARAIVIACCLG